MSEARRAIVLSMANEDSVVLPVRCWQHGDYPYKVALSLATAERWRTFFHRAPPPVVTAWLYPNDPVFDMPCGTAADCILPAFRLSIAMGVRDDWYEAVGCCDLADRAAQGWRERRDGLDGHLIDLDALLAVCMEHPSPMRAALLGYRQALNDSCC